MTTLIALGLRLILLAALTFGFVVLFEHGPANYGDNAKKEWETFVAFTRNLSSQPEETPPPAPVATPAPDAAPETTPEPTPESAPESTPTPNPAPSAWEALQNRPIGDGMNQPIGATPTQ